MPTRPQIENAFAQPTFQLQLYVNGTWTIVDPKYILSIEGNAASTINEDNPIGFGDASEQTCTIVVTTDIPYTAWALVPVRVYLGFEGSNNLYFSGIIKQRSRDMYTISYDCGGFNEKIKNTTAYSKLFFNTPCATQTTVSSIEDPNATGYKAGLINYILWVSGGRPLEQSQNYTNAIFYYHCDPALYKTYASWVAGENIWDEALKIARASGGQLYQDVDGVIKYKNPLSFGNGTVTYTFTDSKYGSISEDGTTAELVGEVRCNYTPRYIGPLQQIYQDTTSRLIPGSSTIAITCETQWPIYQLVIDPTLLQLPKREAMIQAVYFDGSQVPVGSQSVTGYQVTLTSVSAQRVVFNLTNNSAQAIVVHKITLYGMPLLAMDQKSFTYSSGEPQKILEDNVYVQSEAHAERLCRMVKDFYGVSRPQRTLSDCGFDPDRFVGEIVNLTCQPWSIQDAPHRIVSIDHSDTGVTMNVALVPIDGLPTDNTFYIVDNSYASSDNKQMGY